MVDEVSMISAELFEKVDEVLKRIRRAKTAFGGIQVVSILASYSQIPVNNRSSYLRYPEHSVHVFFHDLSCFSAPITPKLCDYVCVGACVT